MVKAVREIEAALGTIDYQLTEKQLLGRDFARSLYIVKNVKKGEEISPENIRSIRLGMDYTQNIFPHYLEKNSKTITPWEQEWNFLMEFKSLK